MHFWEMSASFVLLACSDSAANMALGFVDLQHLFHLLVQYRMKFGKPFAQIFMYRTFADTELFGGSADGGPVLYNVLSQAYGPLFDVSLQKTTLPAYC